MLTAAEIRKKYIQFFVERDHPHIASSPIVPPDDPTMMFCSAGMVQFKALYSGAVELPYTRATSVQKCLRAGGKGSDLENVGKTLRHHTFFEMLGNFSFGDYFKREAITWAWEFCTSPEWLGLPAERLWPTIFGVERSNGEWEIDTEAEEIWLKETGTVNPVHKLNEKENFWGPAGETGACGPCSELLFFMGSEEELKRYQALAASDDPADRAQVLEAILEEGDLFLEIWNLVFPQFDQQLDGSRPPLKNRGIDTGAGLERVTTACQFNASGGKINTPYETEMMQPSIKVISEIAGLPYPMLVGSEDAEATLKEKGYDPTTVRLAMNACADHARALTFTLAEGIVPSNEGRGYVLRRILRRAARFGKKIGISDPFLWKLVRPVIEIMGEAYPEITKTPDVIERTIRNEEERFNRTLNHGTELLESLMKGKAKGDTLEGSEVYRLYETYGYPLELTMESAEERGLKVDVAGYEKALAESKAQARASWKGGAGTGIWADLLKDLPETGKTVFSGYTQTEDEGKILAIVQGEARIEKLETGQSAVVVLDRTPFYAESGGQIGDSGQFLNGDAPVFNVEDTQKTGEGFYLHFGETQEALTVGDAIKTCVDTSRREATKRNHSVTHLMQGALKRLIGQHVTQQGSFVGPEGLRFDFTNPEPVSEAQLREIETLVNEQVRLNLPVTTEEMDLETARKTGAIAPFGEKYGARVRVVQMGEFSTEFCGGTHVGATGDIGAFVVTGESSVAAGIRRIEAKAGGPAIDQITQERRQLAALAQQLSVKPEALGERLGAMTQEIKNLKRELDVIRAEKAKASMGDALSDAVEIEGIKAMMIEIPEANHQTLAETWDQLKAKSPETTLGALYSVVDGKINLIVGATDDIAGKRVKAGDVMAGLGKIIDGKGGGRPNLARGGGSEPDKLPAAKEAFTQIVAEAVK